MSAARWFVYDLVTDPVTHEVQKFPVGNLCWKCGRATEAWPLLQLQEILEKLRSDLSSLNLSQRPPLLPKKLQSG